MTRKFQFKGLRKVVTKYPWWERSGRPSTSRERAASRDLDATGQELRHGRSGRHVGIEDHAEVRMGCGGLHRG